jgi:hypothetical protein
MPLGGTIRSEKIFKRRSGGFRGLSGDRAVSGGDVVRHPDVGREPVGLTVGLEVAGAEPSVGARQDGEATVLVDIDLRASRGWSGVGVDDPWAA